VAEAQPFLRFRIERVLQSADLRTNEGRAKAAEAALAVVADHPNGLVRDQYLMVVADRCRLDATSLRGLLEELVRRGPDVSSGRDASTRRESATRPSEDSGRRAAVATNGAGPGGRRSPDGDAQRAGLEALRLVVHEPSSVANRLEPLLFSDERQRAAFATLSTAGDLHGAIRCAEDDSPDVAVLLRRLAVEEPAADADDVVVQLVWNASRRALADLDSESRLSPDDFAALSKVTARVRCDIEELELKDGDGAIKAADRLLAWLIERGEESA
jgi:DNA primase